MILQDTFSMLLNYSSYSTMYNIPVHVFIDNSFYLEYLKSINVQHTNNFPLALLFHLINTTLNVIKHIKQQHMMLKISR